MAIHTIIVTWFYQPQLQSILVKCSVIMGIMLTPMCGLRALLQILLMGLFLVFFGLPAVKEYLKQEVMVVETKKDTSGIPAPAVTVTVMPSNRSQKAECFDSTGSIEDCIEATTYNRSQTLHDVVLGFTKRESVGKEENFYTEDYTASLTGRQYSFNLPMKIGTNGNDEQLFLFLLPDHVYTIFLHDPHYFVYNTNPVALPTLMRKFDTRTTVSQYYRLALTEVNELNLPADPCDNYPENPFHACIRQNVSGQVSFKYAPVSLEHSYSGWL